MSKTKKFRGLKFKYKIDGISNELTNKFQTLEEFLETEFPKNDNPLSPTNDTKIYDITWNAYMVSINKNVNTVTDLKRILSGDCYVSNTDIRLDKIKSRELERKSTHSIEQIRELTKDVLFEKDKRNAKVELDGDIIKGNSQRYQTFFKKGTKCICCGIEGKYFAKEKVSCDKSYHLNLYAIDENNKEVLMTKDHILPKSKGGQNNIDNYQTMCIRCNEAKGNNLEE